MTEREKLLEPFMPKDPLMAMAWVSGLHFILGEADILAAFREETGNHWQPGKTGFEQMIDEATEADVAFFQQFAAWYNQNYWGPLD